MYHWLFFIKRRQLRGNAGKNLLDFVHGSNVTGLDVVLESLDLLLQLLDGDLLVFDRAHYLELVDAGPVLLVDLEEVDGAVL